MDKVSDAFKGAVNVSSFFAGIVTELYLVIIGYGYADNIVWLKEWQTLSSGIFATLAAAATLWAIRLQIAQVDEHANENRYRRNLAARAALSQPLSNIVGVQKSIINSLKISLENESADQLVPFTPGLYPQVADTDLSKVIACIVDAELPPADDLSKLVSQLQVQNARLGIDGNRRRIRRRETEVRTTIEHYLVDALFIYARAEGLILYARKEDEDYKIRVLAEAFTSAALLNHVDDLNDSFNSTFQRRIEREKRDYVD